MKIGCCIAAIVAYIAEVFATVWAIVDLINTPRRHEVLDVVILVAVTLSVLGGASRSK